MVNSENKDTAAMCEVYKAEAEALRKAVADRDAKIAELNRRISELKEQEQ